MILTSTSYNQSRKRNFITFVFALVYIIVGISLISLNFSGKISSTTFGIGIFILIIASLIFKVATDFLRKKK
jgi:hypothetical protein